MKKIAFILFLSIAIVSCSNDSISDIDNTEVNNNNDNNPGDETNEDDTTTAKLTYTNNIKTIIDSNCIQCHGSPLRSGATFSLTTFESVNNRANSIQSSINNAANPMPTRGLLSTEIRAQFDQWITDGKLE